MGMSASQARMLELTARKNNVEFQGQQINQERTTLANQSASLNSQLLDLSVPTVPSSSDFSRTVYTYSMNGHDVSIGAMSYNTADGTYDITGSYTTTGSASTSGIALCSNAGTTSSPIYQVQNSEDTSSGVTVLTAVNITDDTSTIDDDSEVAANIAALKIAFGTSSLSGTYYSYTTGGQTRYFSGTDLAASTASTADGLTTYRAVDEDAEIEQSTSIDSAICTWSDSNRLESITTQDGEEYQVSVTTETDDAAYEDAYNEYEYQQQLYEQQMDEINAQIEIIQSQDKTLELQLSQLDTEQSAISTEMEAVTKVIEKNVESTFKTFG